MSKAQQTHQPIIIAQVRHLDLEGNDLGGHTIAADREEV